MELSRVDNLIADEYRFLVAERAGWSLVAGPQDLELVAHALRVLLHTHALGDFRDEYRALVACQHADGGWAPESAEPESTVWVSAFSALMLIRGNRVLAEDGLTASVRRAIDYFLAAQESDGRWVDPRWADLDTTSHPVSFFNVVLALDERHRRAEVEHAWRRGLGFILEHQAAGGGWHDANFHPSGVEITAHLIQDALVGDLVLGERVPGIRESCRKGLAKLRDWRILGDDRATTGAIERGLAWILAKKNPRGWGDFPGLETNLERTCDGIDALCKYRAFRAADPKAAVRLWGYVP